MVLEVKNMCVKFYKEPNVIDNFSTIFDRDTLILCECDGGKSLLLRAMSNLVKHKGEVLFNGEILNVKSNILSLILDNPVLLENKTVIYNLKFLQNVIKNYEKMAQYDNILIKFNFIKYKNTKVKDLDLFHKRVLCLIRAYIKDSKILLLDDFFKDLTNQQILILKNYLLLFDGKLKIFTSSQYTPFADMNLEVLYMRFGKICCMQNRDLFLAKIFGNVQPVKFSNLRKVCLMHHVSINDDNLDIIRTEAIDLNLLYFENFKNKFIVYDGITKDVLTNIEKE